MLGADAVEDGQHLILLDELARQVIVFATSTRVEVLVSIFRPRRRVRIDVFEVRIGTRADGAVPAAGPLMGIVRADRDRGSR